MGVMAEIMGAKDKYLEKEMATWNKEWRSREIDSFFDRTKKFFGIVNRDEDCIVRLANDISIEQSEVSAFSDTVLMPKEAAFVLIKSNPRYTEYYTHTQFLRAMLTAM
jgi:hypothetical protein